MKKKSLILVSIIVATLVVYFYFIPAFAGRIFVSPVINLGFIQIRWYGIIMALAVLAGYFVARKKSWKLGISPADVDNYTFWSVIVGVIGARLYFAVFDYQYFVSNPTEIYKVWHGGLSIYGAIIAGLIFTYFFTRKKAYTFAQLFNLAALSVPLGQAVGRFGNFFNQEAFGSPTNLPWKMYVAPQYRPAEFSQASFFHPAFLYEAIFDLFIFFVLWKMFGKSKTGNIGLMFLALYSLGRFFIEGIRVDSVFINGLRADQIIALLIMIIAGAIIVFRNKETVKKS